MASNEGAGCFCADAQGEEAEVDIACTRIYPPIPPSRSRRQLLVQMRGHEHGDEGGNGIGNWLSV